MLATIDEAQSKLRERLAGQESLREALEKLRKENDLLRRRLDKLDTDKADKPAGK
jgi:hypothetical protein